jgi:predicted RNase H-like HicB family nuclease
LLETVLERGEVNSLTPEEYLAIPYILIMESVEKPDGNWVRRAEYPELPGCVAEALSPLEALDKLDEARVRYILERLRRGEPVPAPRPPLRSRAASAKQERLRFDREAESANGMDRRG